MQAVEFSEGADAEAAALATFEPDQALQSQAREFCGTIEGTGCVRGADESLAAMTSDPAVHNIPEGLFWTGTEAVAEMVGLYSSTDEIGCGDDIITNGEWSASVLPVSSLFDLSVSHPQVLRRVS